MLRHARINAGGIYSRQKLKADQGKLDKFIDTVRDNQTRIWKNRSANEIEDIRNKAKRSQRMTLDAMTAEERSSKFNTVHLQHKSLRRVEDMLPELEKLSIDDAATYKIKLNKNQSAYDQVQHVVELNICKLLDISNG